MSVTNRIRHWLQHTIIAALLRHALEHGVIECEDYTIRMVEEPDEYCLNPGDIVITKNEKH